MAPKSTKKSKLLRLTIRNEFRSEQFELSKDTLIEDLRGLISNRFKVNSRNIYIIYKGNRVKNDDQTLAQLGVENDSTLHFINFSLSSLLQTKYRFPFNIHDYNGANMFKLFGKKPNLTLCEIQQEMQKEFMQNPALLKKTLEQPFVAQFMQNTDNLKKLLENNPFMEELYEKFPKLKQSISDPELLQQSMEMGKNSAMLYELTDSSSRLNMQPGDISNLMSNSNEQSNNIKNEEEQCCSSSNNNNNTQETQATSKFTVEHLLNDLYENPIILKNVIHNPYFEAILKSYQEDPQKAAELCYATGIYGTGNDVKEMLNKLMPSMLDIFSSPACKAIYDNPELLKSHIQMHLTYSNILQMSPDFYHNVLNQSNANNSNNDEKGEKMDTNNDESFPENGFLDFQEYMHNIVNNMVNQSEKTPPEIKYGAYLDHLSKIGFTNTKDNIRILEQFNGDLNTTINFMLNKADQ